MIRRLSISAAAAVVTAIAVAGPAHAATEVEVVDSAYEPKTVTIRAGGTVRWHQTGSLPHTVTSSNGSFDSGTMNEGDDYTRTFNSPGTFRYYCTLHGTAEGTGMAGTVVVRASASGGDVDPDDVDAQAGGLARTGSPALAIPGIALVALGWWVMDLERIRAARHRSRA